MRASVVVERRDLRRHAMSAARRRARASRVGPARSQRLRGRRRARARRRLVDQLRAALRAATAMSAGVDPPLELVAPGQEVVDPGGTVYT